MDLIYVCYPRSSSHINFIESIIGDNDFLILPIRGLNHKNAFLDINQWSFYNRLKFRKKIKQYIFKKKVKLVIPFFFELPNSSLDIVFYEEGLSAYQKNIALSYSLGLKRKFLDTLTRIFINIFLFHESKELKEILIGPNYSVFGEKKSSYKYYVSDLGAILKPEHKRLVEKIQIPKKSFNEEKYPSLNIFILDPLIKNSVIDIDIFLNFLNTKFHLFGEKLFFQLHPLDLLFKKQIESIFKNHLRINYGFVEIKSFDQLGCNYTLYGLNSSMLYYANVFCGITIKYFYKEYMKYDKNYFDEYLRRYGKQK